MIDHNFFNIKDVSYIKVGGFVKGYLETSDINKVKEIILKEKKIRFIGNTTNTLFSFDYSDTFFVKYLGKNIEIEDDFIVCECGVSLSFLASFSLKYNISSFYQFSLIPGLLSGAIVTNASSYGKAISHDLLFIEVMTLEGKFKIIKKEEIIFSYHDSSLKEENFFIYKAYFKKRTSRYDIKPLKSYYETKKLTTQDYAFKSLGSTFQNINFFPIGKMIQKEWKNKINLYQCKFSSIHGNFLLVSSSLPYENILKLIESTSLLLYNKLGFDLQKEIEIIE